MVEWAGGLVGWWVQGLVSWAGLLDCTSLRTTGLQILELAIELRTHTCQHIMLHFTLCVR